MDTTTSINDAARICYGAETAEELQKTTEVLRHPQDADPDLYSPEREAWNDDKEYEFECYLHYQEAERQFIEEDRLRRIDEEEDRHIAWMEAERAAGRI